MPKHILLPTFYNEDEKQLLEGTSLEAALASKLNSLDREFTYLREKTTSILWCRQYWWDTETGQLTIEDWRYVDAIYRSRALDFPGVGHATVPCIDMANHAIGDATVALYETDVDGNAVLLLRELKAVDVDEEITITYGDEKGACEMLFSYGFIEEGSSTAREMFLDIDIPEDDPLGLAKRRASKAPPGFKLCSLDGHVRWKGPLVWLLCINEEDGLEFKVAQSNDGTTELQMLFKDEVLTDASGLSDLLRKEALWDVFQLRATAMVQSRVEQQLERLQASTRRVQKAQEHGEIHSEIEGYAIELRDLEEALMHAAYECLETTKKSLLESTVVQRYLGAVPEPPPEADEDDFA